MLDWDDEELASILWDESPDTVVPYHEGSEGSHSAAAHKELFKELSSTELERKRSVSKAGGIHSWGNESNSVCNSNTGEILSCLGAEPWKDPNLTDIVKQSPDYKGPNLGRSASTAQNLCLSGDTATQFDKGSGSSQTQPEQQGDGDFVDYSWDDIGSFDELDKIFSNDDPIFGNVGLGGVDELWSASIDADYSLDKPFPSPVKPRVSFPDSLDNAHMQNKVRTEYTHQSNQPISDRDNLRNSVCYNHSDTVILRETTTNSKLLETSLDQTEKDTSLSSPNSSCTALDKLSNKSQVNKQKKYQKGSENKMKGKALLSPYRGHYVSENQLQRFGKQQEPTSMIHPYQSSEHTQQNHQWNRLPIPCENMYNQHPTVPIMPQHLSGVGSFQQKPSAYKVSKGSSHLKPMHTPLTPLFMTPQEKIDKLRRRQQMQAMLAIKKQQQELGHKTSGLDIGRTISKKHFHDTKTETVNGTEKEIEETPSIHPYSGVGYSSPKEILSKVSIAVNEFPAQNSALSQLQDIISKLDSRVRLCIRDSLFRLATSAAQMHYPGDDLSANKSSRDMDYQLSKDEISDHNRSAPMVDAETDTNPIDRTVAHLLFHRPFDIIAKQSEAHSLPVSTQALHGANTVSLVDLPTEYSKGNAELKHSFLPYKESESSFPAAEPQLVSEFLDSSCMDVSGKTSTSEPPRTEEDQNKPPEFEKPCYDESRGTS